MWFEVFLFVPMLLEHHNSVSYQHVVRCHSGTNDHAVSVVRFVSLQEKEQARSVTGLIQSSSSLRSMTGMYTP